MVFDCSWSRILLFKDPFLLCTRAFDADLTLSVALVTLLLFNVSFYLNIEQEIPFFVLFLFVKFTSDAPTINYWRPSSSASWTFFLFWMQTRLMRLLCSISNEHMHVMCVCNCVNLAWVGCVWHINDGNCIIVCTYLISNPSIQCIACTKYKRSWAQHFMKLVCSLS